MDPIGPAQARTGRRAGLAGGPEGYSPGDHLCWVYPDERSWISTVVAYLDEGARGRDQILYVADKPEAALVGDLADLPGRDPMLRSGQLEVMTLSDVYGQVEQFVTARQIESYRTKAQESVEAGYRGLRLAAEASRLVASPEEARKFAVYELQIDVMMAETALTAMCGYDRNLIEPSSARLLSFVHPLCNDGEHRAAAAFYAGTGRVWSLAGEVDIATEEELRLALSAVPDGQDVHLDLTRLDFIDLSGTNELVSLARRLAPTHRLVVHSAPRELSRILEAAWGGIEGMELVGTR